MPPETSQSAIRRLLPRPAALSVTDDAGATHRHDVPRVWLPWIIRERDPVSRTIRRQQMVTGWDQSTSMVMGVVAGAYMILGKKVGLPDYLLLADAFAMGTALGWAMWWNAHRRIEAHWDSLGRQWTDAGLTRGRCPICLYSLAGAEADERGLARCAECGAAWQRNRIRAGGDREQPRWRRIFSAMLGSEMRRTLRDDDGRTFSAERLRTIAARTADCDPQVAASVRRVRAPSTPVRVMAAAAVGAFFLLPLAILLPVMARVPALQTQWLLMLPLLAAPAVLLITMLGCSEFGLTAAARRRQMLTSGLCPVCASRDMTLDHLDSSLSTCAGCGAAWRVDAA